MSTSPTINRELEPSPSSSNQKIPQESEVPTALPAADSGTGSTGSVSSLFHRFKRAAMILGAILSMIAIAYYVYDSYTHEETDDAYVTGHLHNISSRINGVVTQVLVDDNQEVHAGDVLVKLDPAEYMALSVAAKSYYDVAQSNLDRLTPLIDSHAVAPEDVDKARGTRNVDEAEFALSQLEIQYTAISAPAGGYIGRKNVEVGNRISSGQTLMVVVEPNLWIVANFKETQLARMQIGQRVQASIDSIPDKVFEGRVDSFSPATGNEFALLPADNSTGNFTKIVQRVPVKITLDADSVRGYENRIRAGESAIVKVSLIR